MKTVLPLSAFVLALTISNFANAALGKEQIRKTIAEHLTDVRACYEAALHAEPNLEGKVTLNWEVNGKGAVTTASVNDDATTLKNTEVSDCLIKSLKSWNFPKNRKGGVSSINYPFMFSPKKPHK